MGSKVDALLNGQEEIEGREIPTPYIGQELFSRPGEDLLGIIQQSLARATFLETTSILTI